MTQPKLRVACYRMSRCRVSIRLMDSIPGLLFEHGFGVLFASFNVSCKRQLHSLRSLTDRGEPFARDASAPTHSHNGSYGETALEVRGWQEEEEIVQANRRCQDMEYT